MTIPYLLLASRKEEVNGTGGEELSGEDSAKQSPPSTIRNKYEGRSIISHAAHSLSNGAAGEGEVLVLEDLFRDIGGGDDDGRLLA